MVHALRKPVPAGGLEMPATEMAAAGPDGAGTGVRGRPGSSGAITQGGAAFAEARDFLLRLDSATLEDLPALWASLAADKTKQKDKDGTREEREEEDDENDSGQSWLRRLLIIERWAELDAPGSLEFAKSRKEADVRRMVTGVFTIWGTTDPEAAMKALKEEPDPGLQGAAVIGWLRSVSEDPAALIAHASRLSWMEVSKLTKEAFFEQVSQDFLENLHAARPEGLKQLAAWMPPWFGEMLESLDWRRSVREHPDQALAGLESMPLTRDKLADMLSALTPLAKTRPERVTDVLIRLAERQGGELFEPRSWNDSQRKLLETLITTLGPDHPERVGLLLAQTKGNIQGAEILIDTLLRTNPSAALKIAPSLGSIDQFGEVILSPLPTMDTGAALELARNAPPSYHRDKIMDRALLELNRQNPETAKAWVEGLPEGEVRESARLTLDLAAASPELRLMERVGHQWSWEKGEAGEMPRKRLEILTAMAAGDDPQETLNRVTAWPDGPARDLALSMVMNQVASRDDARKALQWAEALPDEAQRAAAYAGVARGWTGFDPVTASEWVAALPEGPVREAAVGSFAGQIANRDPEAGLQWAATLANPDERLKRLREVAGVWKTRDAPAAAEAVRNFPGLSGADRAALLRTLQQPNVPVR